MLKKPTYVPLLHGTCTTAFQIYLADSPELNLPEGPRSAGAYHSGDLAFVFNNVGNFGLDWEAKDYELAKSISKYWTNLQNQETLMASIQLTGRVSQMVIKKLKSLTRQSKQLMESKKKN